MFSLKNMVKTSLLFISVVYVTTGAYAGNARTTAMGLQYDTVWMIQTDEGYVNLNPAYLSKFNQEIFINPVKQYGGILVSPVDQLNLAVTSGVPFPNLNTDAGYPSNPAFTGAPALALTKEQMNVTGSYNLGDMAFGGKVSYTKVHEDNPSTTVKTEKSLINAKAGLFMDLGGGMDIDGAFGIDSWSIKNSTAGVSDYKATPLDMGLLGRFNMALSETNKLHALLSFNMIDRTATVATVKNKDKYTLITCGLSDEISVNKTSIVYAGINFVNSTEKTGTPTTTNTFRAIKYTAGAETALTDYFTLRFGFNRYWYYLQGSKASGAPKTESDIEQNTNFHIGMAFKLGNVDFDWEAGMGLFQDGPNFISGGNAVSTNFEVTYHFDTELSSAPANTTPVVEEPKGKKTK